MDALKSIEAARMALAKAKSIDELLALRGESDADFAAATTQVASDQLPDILDHATEMRLRIDRAIGGWLESHEPTNGRPRKHVNDEMVSGHGNKARIHRTRCRKLLSVPAEEFEGYLSQQRLRGCRIAYKDVLKLAARQAVEVVPADEPEQSTRSVTALDDIAGKKFGTIYADPPWQYGNQATRASTDNHYGTMSVADIAAMPISEFAADDAHLHIWTTNAFLPETFRVIEAWGFEYRSCFVWVKPQMGIGNYWRVSHEFLLLGIRGSAKRFNDRALASWGQFDRAKHSAKPEAVRGFIERASPGPFLELFGRKPVDGWTVFGNQIEQRLFAG